MGYMVWGIVLWGVVNNGDFNYNKDSLLWGGGQ